MIRIEGTRFGVVEVGDDAVIEFPNGLVGFPAETRFVDAMPRAGGILVYSVTAFDSAGNESPRSSPLQIRP